MANTSKYQVYGFGKGDRSVRITWLMNELGIPFEFKQLDWEKGENETPEYMKINPVGMCPSIVEDGRPMFESVAITMYLADKYRGIKALAPSLDSPARADYMKWCLFIGATVDSKFNELMYLKFMGPAEEYQAKKPGLVDEIKHMGRVIEGALQGKDYIAGNEFSAADIIVAGMSYFMLQDEVCPEKEFTVLNAYCERLIGRSAAKATGGFTAS